MATVWFEKAILTSPYMVAGKAVPFDALDGNHGVIALDSEKDGSLIAALNEAADKVKGGVGRITAEKYESLKKNRPWKPSAPKSWLDEPLRIAGKKIKQPPPPGQRLAEPARPTATATTTNVEPEVPQRPPDQPDFKSESFKPATRKLGKAAQASSEV